MADCAAEAIGTSPFYAYPPEMVDGLMEHPTGPVPVELDEPVREER